MKSISSRGIIRASLGLLSLLPSLTQGAGFADVDADFSRISPTHIVDNGRSYVHQGTFSGGIRPTFTTSTKRHGARSLYFAGPGSSTGGKTPFRSHFWIAQGGLKYGETNYLGFSFRLDPNFGKVNIWYQLMQMIHLGEDAHNVIDIKKGTNNVLAIFGRYGRNYDTRVEAFQKDIVIDRGQWYDVVIKFRHSNGSDGIYDFLMKKANQPPSQYKQYIRYRGRFGFSNPIKVPFDKRIPNVRQFESNCMMGIYRAKQNPQQNLWMDNIKIGPLFSHVDPHNNITPSGGFQKLQYKHSGRCIDNKGSRNDRSSYHQWDCTGSGDRNRNFRFEESGGAGSGWFRLRNQNSGKCLDSWGDNNARGGRIWQFTCNNGSNQQWRMINDGGGHFKLQSRNTKNCIDTNGRNNRSTVYQWGCSGSNNKLRFR